MMTKTQKQKAEEIRQTLAPICADVQKLARIYTKTGAKHGKAWRVFIAWQTVGRSAHALDAYTAEEVAKMEEMRKNDPKEWAKHYHQASEEEQKAEQAHNIARINLKNMLSYAARVLASLVDLDEWKDHEARHLAQFLTIGEPGAPFRVLFSFNSYAQEIAATCCNEWGKEWEAQGNNRPQLVTVASYNKTVKKLKEIKAKAEKLEKQSRDTVRAAGLYGFIPFIIDVKESL